MDPVIIGLLGAFGAICGLGGAFVGAKIAAAATDRASIAAEKRHFRDLGMKVAMTNLEYATKMAQAAANIHGKMIEIPPLKIFLIQSINLVEIISDTSLSDRAMARKITNCEDLAQSIYEDAQARAKKQD